MSKNIRLISMEKPNAHVKLLASVLGCEAVETPSADMVFYPNDYCLVYGLPTDKEQGRVAQQIQQCVDYSVIRGFFPFSSVIYLDFLAGADYLIFENKLQLKQSHLDFRGMSSQPQQVVIAPLRFFQRGHVNKTVGSEVKTLCLTHVREPSEVKEVEDFVQTQNRQCVVVHSPTKSPDYDLSSPSLIPVRQGVKLSGDRKLNEVSGHGSRNFVSAVLPYTKFYVIHGDLSRTRSMSDVITEKMLTAVYHGARLYFTPATIESAKPYMVRKMVKMNERKYDAQCDYLENILSVDDYATMLKGFLDA